MKKLIMLVMMFITFTCYTQITPKEPNKVSLSVNSKGDTLITFFLKDAKIILSELLDKNIVDSLLTEYKIRDSINTKTISLKTRDVRDLQMESINKDRQIEKLEKIIENRIKEILDDEDIIKAQKKEITKQKIFKVISMIAAVILPVLVLIVTLK